MRVIVAKASEIPPGGSKRVSVAGRDIALFHANGRFRAIQDRCPHEGASLCAGRLVGLAASPRPGAYTLTRNQEFVRCPWHGWEFDITTGQSYCDPELMRVRSYPARVIEPEQAVRGPFVAETYPVSVEKGQVMLDIGAANTIGVVVARRVERGRVVVLDLVAEDATELPRFEAGAHVDVHLAAGLVRQYSLCGDPTRSDAYRIAVLRSDSSRGGSAAVHTEIETGHALRISQPRNNFPLDETARRSILIGGGIGITPLVAMAYRLASIGADFELHYIVRDAASAPFLDELRADPIGPHLRVHIGGVDPRFDAAEALAAVAADALAADVADARESVPDTQVYVCGPDRLTDAVTCAMPAHARDHLHSERFAAEIDRTGAPVVVTAVRSGITVHVDGSRTIAEVLAEHGVSVPVSCEQGLCGSCVTTVLAGSPDHRDKVLSDAEKSNGDRMMICCSRALTPTLTLNI